MSHFIRLCFFYCSLLVISTSTFAQSQKYRIFLDLTAPKNDRLHVRMLTPTMHHDSIEFRIPKIVPGTYAIYDFGRFIHDFKAFDFEGNQLDVKSITANRRLISNATKLYSIQYWVEDTYDTDLDNVVFEPAGTNIEKSENHVLNTFGFFGYLKGYKNIPYELRIAHEKNHFGSSSLRKISSSDTLDIYTSESYVALADEPIMYCEPDTSHLQVGNTEVLISVYSPKGRLTSAFVKDNVKEILHATKKYLGGTLPVDRYAFILYLTQTPTLSKSFGALEHSYSSFYVLPEISPILLAQTIKDVAAHEFFHIVTPLNVHSEEIGNFDFISPSMSKHLWMYEGVTEYFAGHVQMTNAVIDSIGYLNILKEKIDNSMKYKDDLPFTEMSSTCLDINKDQYLNVYEKGALIGLHLDILLREESGGTYGLVDLLQALSEKYGKDKSFVDEKLFDIIETLTYPSIRHFLDTYVAGRLSLPHEELFKKVGITYSPPKTFQGLTMGNISFTAVKKSGKIAINSTKNMNEFGKKMGYKTDDILMKFNKKKINLSNIKSVVDDFKSTKKDGDQITAIVKRKVKENKYKRVRLSAKAMKVSLKSSTELSYSPLANVDQLKLRQSWFRK